MDPPVQWKRPRHDSSRRWDRHLAGGFPNISGSPADLRSSESPRDCGGTAQGDHPDRRLSQQLPSRRSHPSIRTSRAPIREPNGPGEVPESPSSSSREAARLYGYTGEQEVADGDIQAFLHGNWRFHARVASISPNSMLRTDFLGMLKFSSDTRLRCGSCGPEFAHPHLGQPAAPTPGRSDAAVSD